MKLLCKIISHTAYLRIYLPLILHSQTTFKNHYIF